MTYLITLTSTINSREAEAVDRLLADIEVQYLGIHNLIDIGWYKLEIQLTSAETFVIVNDLLQSVGVTAEIEVA